MYVFCIGDDNGFVVFYDGYNWIGSFKVNFDDFFYVVFFVFKICRVVNIC